MHAPRPGLSTSRVSVPSGFDGEEVSIELHDQLLFMLFQPQPGGRGQHHRSAGLVSNHGGLGRMRAEGASRLDRIAWPALKQPRACGIESGGLALDQQLHALLRLAKRYEGLAGVVLARFQPVAELIDHVFEHDLSVEMALHVADNPFQQGVVQVPA